MQIFNISIFNINIRIIIFDDYDANFYKKKHRWFFEFLYSSSTIFI